MKIPETRAFAAIMEPKVAEVHTEPLGELGPKDVLIKMLACNICTTDYQQWDGKRNHMGFPMAAGHEWTGDVVAVGAEVVEFAVGDRVGPTGSGCGHCRNCRQGMFTDCLTPKGLHKMVGGFRGQRGFANWKIADENSLIKMNKEIAPELCAFLEPVSAVTNGLRKLRVKPGETVVVVGIGVMGLLNAMVAQAYGCRVIVSDVSEKKLKRASEIGKFDVIDSSKCDPVEEVKRLTDGFGADCVIPCVGLTGAYEQAYNMLRANNGRLLLFAAGHPAPELKLDPNKIHYGRTEILGTIGADLEDVVLASELINNHIIDPANCYEGVKYPLSDIQKAYAHAASPDMYRVSVDLQGV